MALPEVVFDAEKIRLERILDHTERLGYRQASFPCEKIEEVYGELRFREKPEGRPTTYASYVMSIDGKIAFEDDEVGPLIAKNNYLDPVGAFADFWILNMLRGNCDGIIIGSGTLIKEPEYSGSAYDRDIIDARLAAGKPIAPWTVVVTRSGRNIPFGNPVFQCEEVPVLICTSPSGYLNLKKEINKEFFLLPTAKNGTDLQIIKELLKENEGKVAVAITGTGSETDARELMKILDAMGMEKVLVESPAYCHQLMQEGLLDELFIDTSCILVGGTATSIGSDKDSFPSTAHPHAEIVSMHLHNANFIYTRYGLRYDVSPGK